MVTTPIIIQMVVIGATLTITPIQATGTILMTLIPTITLMVVIGAMTIRTLMVVTGVIVTTTH